MNDNFDYVTEKLVASGQICLKRIIEVILTDVQKQSDEIWSGSWLEDGKQLQVAIATIGDYMSDLQSWLMPFWYNKFTVMMCEEVTLRFTYAVLSGLSAWPHWRGEEEATMAATMMMTGATSMRLQVTW